MKKVEVGLYKQGQLTRGILEQVECGDCGEVISGNADGTTNTLNFTNNTGGTFTVTNSALLFNDGDGAYWSSHSASQIIASGDSTTHTMIPGTLSVTGNTWITGRELDVAGDIHGKANLTIDSLVNFQTAYTTTLIGYEAGLGWENTSANNTMIGHFAGKGGGPGYGPWVGADDNTGVGYLSMGFLTTGDKNTAIGSVSIGTLTTGSENTIVGYNAGYSTSRDNKNTVVGSEAHAQVYGGGGDTTPGTDAFNVAVGYRSLYFPNRGYKNVALGAQALAGSGVMVAGNQGAVAVGYNALNASQSGDYNIAIGYQAADNITTGDNNISIGKDADPPSATASYQLNIGGIIHGQDAYTDSAISQIGIGTTTPKTKLDVWHDPTNLVAGTGGGEVVTFGGTNAGDLPVAGKLMYMNSSGKWRGVDADNVNYGSDELLAIALGVLPSEGMLLRGFFNAVDSGSSGYLTGSFVKGASLYVSESNYGYYSFTAPNDTNDYIRVIGYGTDTTNIIYFNPDNTHIKLA